MILCKNLKNTVFLCNAILNLLNFLNHVLVWKTCRIIERDQMKFSIINLWINTLIIGTVPVSRNMWIFHNIEKCFSPDLPN